MYTLYARFTILKRFFLTPAAVFIFYTILICKNMNMEAKIGYMRVHTHARPHTRASTHTHTHTHTHVIVVHV